MEFQNKGEGQASWSWACFWVTVTSETNGSAWKFPYVQPPRRWHSAPQPAARSPCGALCSAFPAAHHGQEGFFSQGEAHPPQPVVCQTLHFLQMPKTYLHILGQWQFVFTQNSLPTWNWHTSGLYQATYDQNIKVDWCKGLILYIQKNLEWEWGNLLTTQVRVASAEGRRRSCSQNKAGLCGAGPLQTPHQLNIQLYFHSYRLPFLFLSFSRFLIRGKKNNTSFWDWLKWSDLFILLLRREINFILIRLPY